MKPFKDEPEKEEPVKEEEVRRESSAGVHYASSHDACQWKFYMKYHLGIDEKTVDKALIFGSAFHEAKAEFYLSKSLSNGLDKGIHEIDTNKHRFYDVDDYQFSRGRLKPLFTSWVETYGMDDLELYDIVGVEEEVRLPLEFTPDYVHTQRHDAWLRDRKTGKVYTGETKTASSSLDFTLNSVRMSSQVDGYYWGGVEVFGKEYGGVIIDVSYWSSRSKNPSTIKNQRSEVITKTAYEIKKFQTDIAGLFNEIAAKEHALSKGVPAEFLYRKNPYFCMAYFRKCAYADICNIPSNQKLKHLPDHLEQGVAPKRLDGMTYDPIFYGEGAM